MTERTYIALLRGINVGGKVLKMADLRAAVAALGFDDVRTYLQSGNMVFGAAKTEVGALSRRISDAIRDHASLDVAVMVRDAEAWTRMVAANPYPSAALFPKTVHAFILDGVPDSARLDTLRARQPANEEWQLIDGTLYLHTPDGFGRSVLGGTIERLIKVPATARNWNTVLSLRDMACVS
ncbi:MAG: DUF1697 domain-containing protein [Rhizobium sp.]|nr:DUF1697 domain-containing protein [Rhizobium sp.]